MKNFLIILYAIILQLITGAFVFVYPTPLRIARLGLFYQIFPTYQLGAFLMLISVVLAIHGLILRSHSKWYFLFFIPQYFFLLLTAGSALNYTVIGHYADGIKRPWQFMFLDQLPSFIAGTLYIFAMFDFKKKYE